MSLNFEIEITNPNVARKHDLSMNRKYDVKSMDHESYTIKHPEWDENIEVKFEDAKEFRPKY